MAGRFQCKDQRTRSNRIHSFHTTRDQNDFQWAQARELKLRVPGDESLDHTFWLYGRVPGGRTARRPDRNRSSRESSWSRSGRCCHSTTCQHRTVEARPGQTRLAMSRPRSRLRDLTQTPLADRPGSQFGSAMPPPRWGWGATSGALGVYTRTRNDY